MAHFSSTIDVAANADEAFAYLSDPTNRPEWDSSVRRVVAGDGARGEVGDRYEVTVGFYGKALDATYEIAEVDAPHRIVITTEGKATGRDVIEIIETEHGSQVRLDFTVQLKGIARLLDRGLQVAYAGIGENAVAGVTKQLQAV